MKYMSLVLVLTFVMAIFAPTVNVALAENGTNIYNGSDDNIINQKVNQVVGWVAGVGTGVFTLAFLIITLLLAFASLKPQTKSFMWGAFFTTLIAAVLFFSAYQFAPELQKLSQQ